MSACIFAASGMLYVLVLLWDHVTSRPDLPLPWINFFLLVLFFSFLLAQMATDARQCYREARDNPVRRRAVNVEVDEFRAPLIV